MKAKYILLALLCISTTIFSHELSQNEANNIAQDIYAQSTDEWIEDIGKTADVVGSLIIQRMHNDDQKKITESEQNKEIVIKASMYIASLIVKHIQKKKKRHRNKLLFYQEELLVDQIAEVVLELSKNRNFES